LGAGRYDAQEIKSHPFFASTNWEDVINKKTNPPKPYQKTIKATQNLDEQVYGKYSQPSDTHNLEKNKIDGWSFIGALPPANSQSGTKKKIEKKTSIKNQ
jgi:hypothetical protein